jgi:hypothetical protein
MNFHIGEKVVCVDDSMRVSLRREGWFKRFRPWVKLDHNLNRGDVYLIVGIQTVMCSVSGRKADCLLVAEAWHFKRPKLGFPAFQFRKLVMRKTDISILEKLLIPSHESEGIKA